MSLSDSSTSVIQAATAAWAETQRSGSKLSSSSQNTATVDLRGANGPRALKQWIADALGIASEKLKLRPIAAMIRGDTSADDGPSVISVARSFGLSTTTGARGDAVSYVLETSNDAAAAASASSSTASTNIRGVVKVVKSSSIFQQELTALSLISSILPTPKHANYPRALAAAWANIPLSIPVPAASSGSNSSSGAFARPYSVASMSSTSAGSSSSGSDEEFCCGGLLLMECAEGQPVSELLKATGAAAASSEQRAELLAELIQSLRVAASALAELHLHSTLPSSSPSHAHPFLSETARQMSDMLSKLRLDAYEETKKQWGIEVERMERKLEVLREKAEKDPGSCCIIHGDAHAGNMLWSAEKQRLTLIDLPTMLAATEIDVVEAEAALAAAVPTGTFRLQPHSSSSCPSPPRPSASISPPSLGAQLLLLRGAALAGRDVEHLERKLDSFGTQAGLTSGELSTATTAFRSAYIQAGGLVTPAAGRFFEYRSLLGEVTQLVRHDAKAIKQRMIDQLSRILDREES